MSVDILTGLLLILLPVAFNLFFFLLQKQFQYPDILRQPTSYILEQFQAGGRKLVGLWYGFMLTGILFLPIAILLPQLLLPLGPVYITLSLTCGVLAGMVQVFGLIRWPFIVPYLASAYAAADSQSRREAVEVVFQAFHRYAGVAIGEHLGYLFTSLWSLLICYGIVESALLPDWLGWIGLVPAVGIFSGLFEESGLGWAGAVNAISYILWSIWLIAIGILLIV